MTVDRHCACGLAIGPRSTTGRCRSCGVRHALTKPGARKRMIARNQRVAELLSPEAQERRREHGRWLAEQSQRPAVRAAANRTNEFRRLGWCSIERRDEYRRLTRSLHYSAAEARSIIEADVARKQLRETRR